MEDVPELLKKKGDLRYGQLIWNTLAMLGMIKVPEGNKLFYMEDKDLATALRLFLESYSTPVASMMRSVKELKQPTKGAWASKSGHTSFCVDPYCGGCVNYLVLTQNKKSGGQADDP